MTHFSEKQAAADGFQDGWRAALKRVSEGDSVAELSALVPTGPYDAAQKFLLRVAETNGAIVSSGCAHEIEIADARVRGDWLVIDGLGFILRFKEWRERAEKAVSELAAKAEGSPHQAPEICICAAVQLHNGIVLRGHRHDDCLRTAQNYGYTEYIAQAQQGFVTSRNRFVGREEGAALQTAAGIVSAWTGNLPTFLFSEDLYFNDNVAAATAAKRDPAPPAPQERP